MCEDLLKEMKEDTTLAAMVNIVCVSEGTIHSEELSKQYLETIKVSNKQIDSVHKGKPKGRSDSSVIYFGVLNLSCLVNKEWTMYCCEQ